MCWAAEFAWSGGFAAPEHRAEVVCDRLRREPKLHEPFVVALVIPILAASAEASQAFDQLLKVPVIRAPGEGLGVDSCAVAKRVGWCAMRRGGEPWRGLLII